MSMKSRFNNGLPEYLLKGAEFEGRDDIPRMLDLHNAEIPSRLVPFDKARTEAAKEGYVHFYIDDSGYGDMLANARKYDDLLSGYDGIITPDPTIRIGDPHCHNAAMTMINRAIGYYEQRRGLAVIPNIRWGDPSTYDFCFLGVPRHSVVAISTHGAIARDIKTGNLLRKCFKAGLQEMLGRLEPTDVIVYGRMPDDIFTHEILAMSHFHRFPSEIETAHRKEKI